MQQELASVFGRDSCEWLTVYAGIAQLVQPALASILGLLLLCFDAMRNAFACHVVSAVRMMHVVLHVSSWFSKHLLGKPACGRWLQGSSAT
jgi:hypothetical protein